MSASDRLPQAAPTRGGVRIRAIVDGDEAVLGRSADSENRRGGRCDREPAVRDPRLRQEGRSASPRSSPAIR